MMKRMLLLSLLLLGCRTVAGHYKSSTSSVVVKLPADLASMTATAVFSKQGADPSESTVKGQDMRIRLSHGDYKVTLSILDKKDVVQFVGCDPKESATFPNVGTARKSLP